MIARMNLVLLPGLNKSREAVYDWDDVVQIWDEKEQKERPVRIAEISLYDHRLKLDGEYWAIAGMFSKEV